MTSDSTNELIEEEGEVGTDEEEEAECCTNAFARGLIITVLVLLLIGMLVLAIMISEFGLSRLFVVPRR